MKTFETEPEFSDAVAHAMQPDLPEDLRAAIQGGILEGERADKADETDVRGYNLRVGNWVLRDEDLPVIEVISAVGSGILAIAATGPLGLAAVINGIKSFAKIVWDTWRKSARLGKNEIAVFGLVEVLGPIDEETLVTEAQKLNPDVAPETWGKSILSLTDVELSNGDIVELIRKDASDRWVTS